MGSTTEREREPSVSDIGKLSEFDVRNQALIYSFCLESPYEVPKGINSMLLRQHI